MKYKVITNGVLKFETNDKTEYIQYLIKHKLLAVFAFQAIDKYESCELDLSTT